MAAEYSLEIITKQSVVFSGSVTSLLAHGAQGYLGVLANHAPLATVLIPGKLVVRYANEEMMTYEAGEGFLEVAHNKALILIDRIEGSDSAN